MNKIIIAGGRNFNNYLLLKSKMDFFTKDMDDIQVVSGRARGADALGETWAKEKGFEVIEMPADWEKFGRSAGYRRNEEMAKIATHLVAFWDGESRGTGHMIDLGHKYDLKIRVVRYSFKTINGVRINIATL